MRQFTKGLLIALTSLALLTSCFTVLYTRELSEELTALRREGRSDNVYLRCRVRDLEAELKNYLQEAVGGGEGTFPTGGTADPSFKDEDEAVTDTSAVDREENTSAEPVTEAVTLPVHQSPETQPPEESVTPTALYLLCEHEGILGVFDGTGELLRTVNVMVLTLPKADRDALRVGIPFFSEAELENALEKYE